MTGEALTRLGNNPGYARLGFVRAYYWGSFVDITYNGAARTAGATTSRCPRSRVRTRPASPPGATTWPTGHGRHADQQQGQEPGAARPVGRPPDGAGVDRLRLRRHSRTRTGRGRRRARRASTASRRSTRSTSGRPRSNTSWNQYSVMYRTNDFRLCQFADPKNPNFEKDLYEASTTPYEPYASKKEWELPPVIFDESQAAQNADTATSLSNHVKQSMAQFATGKKDINDDAAWDSYLKDMDKMGLACLPVQLPAGLRQPPEGLSTWRCSPAHAVAGTARIGEAKSDQRLPGHQHLPAGDVHARGAVPAGLRLQLVVLLGGGDQLRRGEAVARRVQRRCLPDDPARARARHRVPELAVLLGRGRV